MWTIVANRVSPTRGIQGALVRHAVMRDLVSVTSRMNRNMKNAVIPLHADAMWNFHPGNFSIWNPRDSIKSGRVVSTARKAQAPANKAIISVVGV